MTQDISCGDRTRAPYSQICNPLSSAIVPAPSQGSLGTRPESESKLGWGKYGGRMSTLMRNSRNMLQHSMAWRPPSQCCMYYEVCAACNRRDR